MIIEKDLLSSEDDNGPTTGSLISEILKKYNLKESIDVEVKRIMQDGDAPNSVIVQWLSRDFAKGLISEKDFIDSLKKKLTTSSEIAKNIVTEIIEKVIPLIKNNIKNKVTVEKQTETAQTRLVNNQPSVGIPVKSKIPKDIINPIENKKIKEIQQGPDNYREPIE